MPPGSLVWWPSALSFPPSHESIQLQVTFQPTGSALHFTDEQSRAQRGDVTTKSAPVVRAQVQELEQDQDLVGSVFKMQTLLCLSG